jgi:hypothetical protein
MVFNVVRELVFLKRRHDARQLWLLVDVVFAVFLKEGGYLNVL